MRSGIDASSEVTGLGRVCPSRWESVEMRPEQYLLVRLACISFAAILLIRLAEPRLLNTLKYRLSVRIDGCAERKAVIARELPRGKSSMRCCACGFSGAPATTDCQMAICGPETVL